MTDPVAIFLKFRDIIKSFRKKKQGRILGSIPACVSFHKDIRLAAKKEKESRVYRDDTDQEEYETLQVQKREAFQDVYHILEQQVPHTYYCGGQIKLTELLQQKKDKKFTSFGLKIRNGNKDIATLQDLLSIDVEALKELASPSGFGNLATQQTVVDENVRKAFEIKATELQLVEFFQTDEEKIDWNGNTFHSRFEHYIQSELTNCQVKLKAHKLNIYEEGGFFQYHVDTPKHGSKQLGTLVICLPVEHRGGELVIKHENERQIFDFGRVSGEDYLQWVAFFGDCVHKVKPVTWGTRITLTYDILISHSRWAPKPCEPFSCEHQILGTGDMSSSYCRKLYDALQKLAPILVKDREDETEPVYVGLLLEQRYPLDICNHPNHLKGKDAALYQYLKQRYDVHVQTVIHNESYWYNHCEEIDTEENRHSVVKRFTQEDYDALCSGNTQLPPSAFPDSIPFIPMRGKQHELSSKRQKGAEYAGNEALCTSIDVVYYDAALLVQLATPHKRQKKTRE